MTQTNEPISFRLLKTAFESENYPAMFSGKQTDQPAFNLIGQIIPYTQDYDLIYKIIESAMPSDYSGDTLQQVKNKIDRTIEKGWADRDIGEEKDTKKSASSSLLELIEDNPNIALFNDGFSRTFITITDDNGTRTLSLSSTAAQQWLKHQFYKNKGKAMSGNAFKEAHDTLMAKALFDAETREVFLRMAEVDSKIVFNLADDSGTLVVIDGDGWETTNEPLAAFVKSHSMASMPLPVKSSAPVLNKFKLLMGLSDSNFHRVLAFVINALRPNGPYILLLLEGEQGSGKSLLSEFIKKWVDRGQARNVRLPESARDLMIQAQSAHLLVFDNISGIKAEISDALCSLSTGGGFETRKLYTDDELQIFDVARPFILNGITGVANRPDLLERSLSLRLPSMPDQQRKTETELREEFHKILPELMGALFDVVAYAIDNFDKVETPKEFRMADAAKWLMAAEPATGLPEGALIAALAGSQRDIVLELMASDSLAIALTKVVQIKAFDGTLGGLYEQLEEYRPRHDRYFPNSSSQLSKALVRNRKALETAGIMVEIGPKVRKGKTVKVWLSEETDFEEMLAVSTGYKPAIDV